MMRKLAITVWVMFSFGLAFGQAPTTRTSTAGGQLLQACIKGDAKQVATILSTDADLVNVRRVEDGATPLHLAKNAAVAAILLENGADIEATDTENKSTPLHWAIDREMWNGKSDTAAYLMDQGAKSDDFLCLCAFGKTDKIKPMVEKDPSLAKVSPQPGDVLGGTALHVAVEYGHQDLVEFLIAHGADVNALRQATPLHMAAWFDRVEIAKILLVHGANMEMFDRDYHETPLGWAVYAGQSEMAKFLLSRGAKVRQVDIHNAQTGEQGHNDAGRGATVDDYKNVEKMLRAAKAPN